MIGSRTALSGNVRTVLGDIAAADLGPANYHEHLFQVTPLLPGDELDDEAASGEEAVLLRDSGFTAMVDATPIGLGRRPGALARISRTTSLRVVATTGVHKEEHYGGDHWVLAASEQELATAFRDDVLLGLPRDDTIATAGRTTVRAGMIKMGVGYWRISAFERRAASAVGAAHCVTGAPVMVHLEHGSAGHEVLDLLEREGVALSSVVLAHVDRNPDPQLHADLAARGAYLGYDGFARHREWPDSVVLACMAAAAAVGATERLVIGGDVARRTRYLSYGGMPGLGYVGSRVVPRLREVVGESVTRKVLVENPARLLGRF